MSLRNRFVLWLNRITSPEGCTATDARVLRLVNHSLVEDAASVRDQLRQIYNTSLRFTNAVKDACVEIQNCPDDSIQDIFNEAFDKWETGLQMDHNFNIETKNF